MMTNEQRKAEVERIAAFLAEGNGSWMSNPTFVARDLGFADNTAIHKAVRPILARYAAWVLVESGLDTTELYK